MDEKSLEILEFPQVKQILAGHTSFSASREMVMGLQPLSDFAEVSRLLRKSAEARQLLELEPSFSIGGVKDVRQAVMMAARGKVLAPPTLIDIQETLAALAALHGRLRRLSDELPALWEVGSGIHELRQLEHDIERCFGPNCEVMDSASPKLASVRQNLKESRDRLLAKLGAIVRSPRGQTVLSDPIVTEREGRYVIPVKAEYRREMRGIVHDISNTGATVFMEPWATVEDGNTIRELAMEEKREIEKLLAALSAQAGSYEVEISQGIVRAADIDLALAKARYARAARAFEPVIVRPEEGKKPILRLIQARHPLLGKKAVPLSMEMGEAFSTLVITGPNTGGKTVALKTAGLLSLMALSGIPVPAAPDSQIPFFDNVFADIGDEQSIEQTLSTFSWHIKNIVRILTEATPRSLVLLDELGTSTDPAEGSALARAILKDLLARGIMTIATTHFGDLKAFAHMTPGMQNASFAFDPVTLAPTYQLMVGIPGGSNALATASRLGLPREIVEGARGMLARGTQELETLLGDLMEDRKKAESLRAGLEKETEELHRRNEELEGELRKTRLDRQKVVQEARDTVVRELADLQREIRETSAELRRERTKDRADEARKALARLRERLKSAPLTVPAAAEPEAVEEDTSISPGDTVLVRDTGLAATVLFISEETQQVEVQAGQIKLRLGIEGVAKAGAASVKARSYPAPLPRRPAPKKAVSRELDLRGKRAEEVEPELDSYLNDAAIAGLAEACIIHGFGTGTVRSIVRDYLASYPLVKSFRPGERGEGGDGVTIVKL